MMDDLLADFIAETREMLEAIETEIVAWEAAPSDQTRLDTIFRFFHTVKGNCGFFDLPRLERLAHAAESALAGIRSGARQPDTQLVNAALAIVDRIAEMVTAIETGAALDHNLDEELIARLGLTPAERAQPGNASIAGNTNPARETAKPAAAHSPVRSIRVPVDLLDQLMSGVSDMVLTRNDLARRLNQEKHRTILEGPFDRLSSILDDMRDNVTKMRMQRIEYLYSSLPRLIRDLSAELGKKVELQLAGGEVKMDREMIEMIRDPLTHIIRNAIDHGIEDPKTRTALGKPSTGTLTIAARQVGNNILLSVKDDGAGINTGKVAKKAIAAGILSIAEAETLSEEQKLDFIFSPGISTAAQVSEVSGRGVGMDVVRSNLDRIGGAIQVDSEANKGSHFTLQLPLTLSIIAGLTISCGGQQFAIPRMQIAEIIGGAAARLEVEQIGRTWFVTHRGQRVPCMPLATILGLEAQVEMSKSVFILSMLANGNLAAIAVDKAQDNKDLVVKPLAPAIMATKTFAGSTLLDDGHPILLLDLPNIAKQYGLSVAQPSQLAHKPASEPSEPATNPAILFEDMAGDLRAIRLDFVSRIQAIDPTDIIESCGTTHALVEGVVTPLLGHSADHEQAEPLSCLRLMEGNRILLYAVRNVIDTSDLPDQITPLPQNDMLEGIALIHGNGYGLLDLKTLFAVHADSAGTSRKPVCQLPDAQEWSQTFLAPLLQNAGFDVIAHGSDVTADIIFELDSTDYSAESRAENQTENESETRANIIRLHSHESDHESNCASSSEDIKPANHRDAIYRYDRDALLRAANAIVGRAY